ncbi:hypothetical protein K1719_021591 [Acacia pycnantha]|nr:hypothetical protein K1719_021591 [Acacia pycnantha]
MGGCRTNTFASASLDRTIKIWNLGSPDPNFTLDAHQKGVNCVDYFTGDDKPYLITVSDDHTAKVWDYQTKSCVQTLEEDGTVRIWHSKTYRLQNTLNYGLERVWAIGYVKGRNRSFGSALEIVWSSDGEYAVRESTSKIKNFSKNFQENKSIRPTFSAERMLIRRIDVNVKADSGDLVTIASDTSFYILKYKCEDFDNLRDIVVSYLDGGRPVDEQGVEDAFELLHEINERVRTGIWVGDCIIYNNSSWRLNYVLCWGRGNYNVSFGSPYVLVGIPC